jgi:hypothetical protein
MLFLNWRVKARRQSALEALVDEYNGVRDQRVEQTVACLTKRYNMEKLAAQELSALLYSAEKLFFQQFIEKQMLDSLDGFYPDLCELLDNFLISIPVSAAPVKPEGDAEDNEKSEKNENNENVENPAEAETDLQSALLPDWGDVFD